MVEFPSIYPELSAYDNMKAQCIILKKPYESISSLLEYVGLSDCGKKPAGNFSLGMRQQLYIAMSLISDPDFMLLNEPINGFDPERIKSVRELLIRFNREKGITILISSHILTELSLLATRYGFIDRGNIIKEVTADDIHKATAARAILTVSDTKKALACLEDPGYSAHLEDGRIYTEREIDLMRLCLEFDRAGVYLQHFDTDAVELEDYFIKLIGSEI